MENTVGFGRVRTVVTNASTNTACHLGMWPLPGNIRTPYVRDKTDHGSFVLKTKEQRAAEKALMDKSPLKTLTLEDFLESERHKLTGTLTPVTPESFAKWKKERLDKKAAEEEARKAKEATGRAMFEKGGWEDSEEESEDDEGDGGERDNWDLQALRRETEALDEKKEAERLAGGSLGNGDSGGGKVREASS
jgi:hypothetical protein